MRIAVCERDVQYAEWLVDLIRKWSEPRKDAVEIKIFLSAEQFLFTLGERKNFDIVFLDTDLKRMGGMELAKYIRKEDEQMLFIFITKDVRFAIEGYEVSAFRYLIKPLNRQQVESVLDQAASKVKYIKEDALVIFGNNEIKRIWKQDVRYVEAKGHYLEIYAKQEKFRIREKMDIFGVKLEEPQFCRCHRAFMFNIYYLEKLSKNEIKLSGGVIIPVSKNRQQKVINCVDSFYGCREYK